MTDTANLFAYAPQVRAIVSATSVDMDFRIVEAPPAPVYRPPFQVVQRLMDEAEKLWGVPQGSIKSKSRRKEHCTPRFAVIYAARRMTRPQRSFPEIGILIGRRDHTTILHGERRALELRRTDPEFASMLACLMLTVWRARKGSVA